MEEAGFGDLADQKVAGQSCRKAGEEHADHDRKGAGIALGRDMALCIHLPDRREKPPVEGRDRNKQRDDADHLCGLGAGESDADQKQDKDQLGPSDPIHQICDQRKDLGIALGALIGGKRSHAVAAFGVGHEVENCDVERFDECKDQQGVG